MLIALLTLAACDRAPGPVELVGSTMGTQFSVKLPNGIGDHDALKLQKKIEAELAEAEALMSTYKPNSVISQFNRSDSTEWFEVLEAFCIKVEQSLDLSEQTNGAFDITVGPLVNLWGFGPGDIVDEPPSDEAVAAALAVTGYENLHSDCARPAIKKDIPDLYLDMSAIGKGYVADRIGTVLVGMGFDSYLVEIGGELSIRGHNAKGEPWAIGIEAPLPGARRPHTIVHLTDTAMATSGDYRNYFEVDGEIYSHSIDARTGKPVTHALASVTVVDKNAHRADALATAILVMGPQEGMEFAEREGLAVLMLLRTDDGIEEHQTRVFKLLRGGS